MYKIIVSICALIAIVLVSGCANTPAQDGLLHLSTDNDYQYPSWSPDGKQIAFIQSLANSIEQKSIWVYNLANQDRTELASVSDLTTFSWSPDAQSIVYSRENNLWRYDLEGATETNLTQNLSGSSLYPLWSPDGNLIAFKLYGEDEVDNFWIMDSTGQNARDLTQNIENTYLNDFSWSYDSSQLIAVSLLSMSVIGIDLDGNLTTLYPGNGATASAVASPVNNQIAVSATPKWDFLDIYLVNGGQPEPRNLTNTPDLTESDPVWSPDGQYIAYLAQPKQANGTFGGELGIINLNDGSSQQITDSVDCVVGHRFTWSADSERIAFECRAGQNTNIWIINRDGSNAVNLTG